MEGRCCQTRRLCTDGARYLTSEATATRVDGRGRLGANAIWQACACAVWSGRAQLGAQQCEEEVQRSFQQGLDDILRMTRPVLIVLFPRSWKCLSCMHIFVNIDVCT
mmetsp:Transcript_67914/g.106126  ORF Transcript_67914/g.106126 Transcript_67914/m.106126 type:complete len:107 (+) Transcript_67914:122-442(+)